MSANLTQTTPYNSTHNSNYFEMNIAIPSYLLAITIGNLTERQVGTRTYVVTEPTMIDKCAAELEDMEQMLDTAQNFLQLPYIWGIYKLLVLPPSFPLGGMENPLITFASPTIIVGDKSQVYVATHEMCHSWTGNEVTCENWSNEWLNEGFTVFEERKVSQILNNVSFALNEAVLGNASLFQDFNTFGFDNSYSALHPNVSGVDPNDAYNNVCYEKGF